MSSGRRWIGMIGIGAVVVVSAGVIMHQTRPRIDQLVEEAREAMKRQDSAAALAIVDRILSRDPSNGAALIFRGHLAREQGQSAAALAYFRRVPNDHQGRAATAR